MFPKLLILLPLSKSSSSFGLDCIDFVTPTRGVLDPMCTTLSVRNRRENSTVWTWSTALDFDPDAFGILHDLDLFDPDAR